MSSIEPPSASASPIRSNEIETKSLDATKHRLEQLPAVGNATIPQTTSEKIAFNLIKYFGDPTNSSFLLKLAGMMAGAASLITLVCAFVFKVAFPTLAALFPPTLIAGLSIIALYILCKVVMHYAEKTFPKEIVYEITLRDQINFIRNEQKKDMELLKKLHEENNVPQSLKQMEMNELKRFQNITNMALEDAQAVEFEQQGTDRVTPHMSPEFMALMLECDSHKYDSYRNAATPDMTDEIHDNLTHANDIAKKNVSHCSSEFQMLLSQAHRRITDMFPNI